MIQKNIDEITKDDIQALIDEEVLEHKSIEYKQVLPGSSDKEKEEFLADVSSFANASGGDIIYGIIEDRQTGKPNKLEGMNIENPDEVIQRLDNIIRAGIQPRLPFVTISPPIPIENSKIVLVIRVPRSWVSPHRVTFKGCDKFYSRSSNGKYPLDVSELRIAFNLSETVIERVRKFREDRISKILASETPIVFCETAKIVLHLIPLISFNPVQRYDIEQIAKYPEKMPPICCSNWSNRYNLDGFLTHDQMDDGKCYSYVQLYRNGIIEAVDGWLLRPERSEGKRIIYRENEMELVKSSEIYLSLLEKLNIETPIFIFLTLIGVKDYSMPKEYAKFGRRSYPIDRDILVLPEVIIDNYVANITEELKPCFDAIWNSCGFPRSLNYNENEEWIHK